MQFIVYLFVRNQLYTFRAAHHQEHLTVLTAYDIVHLSCCRPASWTRWNSSSISSMTLASSKIGGIYHKL